jgi:hypothetical protein
MTRRVRNLSFVGLSTFLLGAVAGAGAEGTQPELNIALDPPIDCWYHSEFPVLGALVSPPSEIVRSRLYFRCSLYPDYYFVDLFDESGTYRGVAPQAEETCPRVHYYVEALSRDFTSTRTEERVADVTSPNECRRRYPAAAWFPGDDPGIMLGSLAGSGLAPGFKSVGIAGFISSTGATIAATAPGGISSGVVAGLAAGGGAAAGIGVLAAGGGSTTTAPQVLAPPPPTTTTAPPTTTTTAAAQAVKACFRIDPPSGNLKVNQVLTIDGRCSEGGANLQFRYDLGDGRIKEGQAFVTVIWPKPGSYTLTLTVTRSPTPFGAAQQDEDSISRQIQVEPEFRPAKAEFTSRAVPPGPCTGEFDGRSSSGDIDSYQWELDVNNELGRGVLAVSGPVVTEDWKRACLSTGGFVTVRLTVLGRDGGSSTIEKRVNIETKGPGLRAGESIESSLVSELLESGGAQGQITLEGGPTRYVSGDTRAHVRYSGRSGRNALEALLVKEAESPVLWRFDFSGARSFVAGSLRVISGQEVARDAYSVVLRFTGSPGERARVEFELEP